ncbi:monooxygenase 2-like [Syzygium oleosum]|uniref:monooxygenase 2-like n=1 Tax=Syzygium oleosum TaxID=219896 RepID=UPI0011D23A7C|nr:monooxygenase 2-like [Syzygium oleosum]
MEAVEDIVIVGAGIAGLATALGLHRLGIRNLVLESHDHLRTTGFALGIWTNGWKALDAVGVGESLRRQHNRLLRVMTSSTISGLCTAEIPLSAMGPQRDHEFRCVQRKILLETLEKELPSGTIKFSSKVVSIEESGYLKLIHLSDGSILKAKLLIGCDGVNSAVAKWLGFKKPAFVARFGIRACVYYENGHGLEPKIFLFMGEGVRYGVIPCDDKTIYWFFSFSPSNQDEEIIDNPSKMKQFVLSKLGKVADNIKAVIDDTELDDMMLSPLRFRHPWEILWGSISKSNVCVAGDAFHPMTPDIAQGGCAALEDGVILARCLGEAMRERQVIKCEGKGMEEEDEYKRMEMGLRNYAKERRWRAFQLITTAYMVGYMAQSNGKIWNFLSNIVLARFLAGQLPRIARYNCGKLRIS